MTYPLAITNQMPFSTSLSSKIVETWTQNTGIRFFASGILGNAIFFWLDKRLLPIILTFTDGGTGTTLSIQRKAEFAPALKWIRQNAESVSFFVAYLLDIVVQHFINALLVFGMDTIKTRELYLSSLATSYTAYFSTLCGSTILQAYLLQHGVPKNLAFWGTILTGSLINFAVLVSFDARSKVSRVSCNQ